MWGWSWLRVLQGCRCCRGLGAVGSAWSWHKPPPSLSLPVPTLLVTGSLSKRECATGQHWCCWQETGTPTWGLPGPGWAELGMGTATVVLVWGCQPPTTHSSSWPGACQHLAAGKRKSDPFQMWLHS